VSAEIEMRRGWRAVDPFDYAQGSITHPLHEAQRMGHPDLWGFAALRMTTLFWGVML
jgi:hypothetical protein